MATDTERLVVELEARIRDFERNFLKASKTSGDNWGKIEFRGAQAARRLESSMAGPVARINRDLAALGSGFSPLKGVTGALTSMKGAASALTTAISVETVRRYADEWTSASNKIAAAGADMNRVPAAMQNIAAIAERSRADFGSTADLYARLTRSAKELGASQLDIASVTETVAKGLKIAGASASETESALIQLGQALGSGKLQGDELRSLSENAPVLVQAIAKEFGVAVGQLKDLGAQGELASARVFKALKNAAPEVETAFGKTNATVADSFKQLETAAIRFVGTSAAIRAATTATSGAIGGLATNFDTVATGAVALGGIIAARLIGAGLTPAVAAFRATTAAALATIPAINAVNGAIALGALQAGAGAVAMRGLSAALALVGGPIGGAILAIGAATLYFSGEATKADERGRSYAAALDRVKASADNASPSVRKLGSDVADAAARMSAVELNQLNGQLRQAQTDINRAVIEIGAALARYPEAIRAIGAANPSLDEVRRALGETSAQALTAKEALARLANSDPNFQRLADAVLPLIDRLAGAIARVRELRAAIAGVSAEAAKAAKDAASPKVPNAGPTWDQLGDAIKRDPVLSVVRGQGELRRKVIDSEMDETARKVRDKAKELHKTIIDGGGNVSLREAEEAAKRIVAAESGGKGKGGGGGGRGGKSDSEKRSEKLEREIELLERERREIEAEAAALGKSNVEKKVAIELSKLNVDAKSSEASRIREIVTATEAARQKVKAFQEAQERAAETAKYFGQTAVDALGDLIFEGKSLNDVFQSIVKSLGKAALQAAVLGTGPLAGLLGGGKGMLGGGAGKATGGGVGKNVGGGGAKALPLPLAAAGGGYVSGPGTGTSDSIPARLSDGEYVVRAAATAKHRRLLELINADRIPRFAAGGPVTVPRVPSLPAMPASAAMGGGDQFVSIAPSINVKVEGGSRGEQADAALAKQLGAEIEKTVRTVVFTELRTQMRPGGMLNR